MTLQAFRETLHLSFVEPLGIGPSGAHQNHHGFGFSSVLCGKTVHTVTGFWKGLAGRFESLPVVRKMMLVRLRSDLNPLALTMAA